MVEINPYYDDVIDGNSADPAYAVRDIPFAQTGTESQLAPATDPRPAIDLDSYAFQELNKLVDESVLPQYQKLTGKTLEENFGKDILLRQISIGQAFKEAGLPYDPNKESVTSAEMQDPVLKPLLDKYGYKTQSPSEGLERVVETFYRAQREAREKRQRGETLTTMEEIDASAPMALIDALDFTGIVGLAFKGAYKVGKAGLKYLLNESAKGTSKKEVLNNFKELFPQDAKALEMSAIEDRRLALNPAASPTVAMAPETGSGLSAYARTRNYLETIDEPQTTRQIGEALDIKPSAVQDFKQQYANDPITQKIRKKDPKNIPEDRVMQEGASTQKITELLNKQKEPLTQQQIADAVGVKRQTVAEYKYKLDKNSPLIKMFRSDKPEGQTELLKNLFEENPNLIFENKKELADKYNIGLTTLKNFIEANPQYNKNFGRVGAVISQGNAGLTDVIRTSNRTLNQKLTQLEEFIATNNEEPVNALYKKFGFGDRDPQTNRPLMSLKTFEQYMRNQKGYVSQKQTQKSLFQDYFPQSYSSSKPDKVRADTTMTRDFFRSDFFKDNDEFVSVMKGFGIEPKNITNEAGKKIPNPNWNPTTNKINKQNFYNAQASILTQKNGYDKLLKKSADANALSRDVSQKFYDGLKNNEDFRNQFISEYNRVFPKGSKAHVPDNNWEEMYKKYKSQFTAQLSHVTPLKDFKKLEGFKGMGAEPDLLTINFGAHNVAVQPRIENVIKDAVRNINQGRDIEKNLTRLRNANSYMVNNNMRTYLRFTDRTMSDETLKKLQDALGDVYIGKDNNQKTIFLGRDEEMTLDELKNLFSEKMFQYIADPKSFRISTGKPLGAKMEDEMLITGSAPYIKKGAPLDFKKGGPVKMAIGGDLLQNINQQQFTPDPAIDDDYFQQAVDSGNLTAFNPFKLFRLFGKVDAVQTPKKITAPKEVDAPEGTTLPATQEIQPQDFPFKSFTLESIMDPNAPKADQPQGWANFLFKGKNVPKSELNDSGLTQFLTDYEKYFPGQKVTQQQLIDYYETSPIGNLSFKVKDEARREISNPQYDQYAGRPRHQDAGNQPLDSQGEDYREIVVEAGPLPGEKKPFVQSGHYNEPNVIGFTRVANYTQPDGKRVAVIQEMQTDMLSKVRKEQERLRAFMTRLENVKQKADETIRRGDDGYYTQRAQDALRDINNKYPPSVMKALEENASLIKPFPNQAAASTIPTYSKQLQELQSQIDQIVKSDLQQSKPETVFQIREISEKQGEVLNSLLDLNRSGQLDNILKDIKIPSSSSTEDLNRFALGDDSFQVEENYGGKALELFPPIPFNKQPDYVDLLIKATIKDAQSKGINKVAIYPPDLVNSRWGKTPGGSSAKKFEDLYGKVAVQQMKNIAKKYDGVAQFEVISDTTKPPKGLEIYSKGVDGQAQLTNKIIASNRESGPGLEKYLDSEIRDLAMDYEPNQVVLSREVAPGQKMEYFVNYNNSKNNFDLVALGSEDKADDALILIQEFNPQEVPMFTITLDSPKAEQPMYLFKKKDGGSIAKDSLVSVTDIYGEYGR